jgi:heme/copper-type cytochrome/quinol oxidase subunit 3
MNIPVLPPPGGELPKLLLPTIGLIILLVSAIPIHYADKATLKQNWAAAKTGMLLNIFCSFAFMALRIFEWHTFSFKWNTQLTEQVVTAPVRQSKIAD